MPYKFTESEQAELLAARKLCPATKDPNGNFVPLYRKLSEIIGRHLGSDNKLDTNTTADLNNAKLWLDVAIGANGGTGMHSAFIRTYTDAFGELIKGKKFTAAEMQIASNVVAVNLWTNLALTEDPLRKWIVPHISIIAAADAAAIGIELYGNMPDDTTSKVNAGWTGTLGFSVLGGESPWETWRLLSAGDTDSEKAEQHNLAKFNKLDDLRNIIFAVSSFDTALKAGFTTAGLEFATYLASAFISRGATLPFVPDDLFAQANIAMSSGKIQPYVKSVAAGTPVAPYINMVADLGVRSALDMLRRSVNGDGVSASKTEVEFKKNAFEFFSQIEDLEKLDVEMISSAANVLSNAKKDFGCMVAIHSLSLFVFKGDESLALLQTRQADLYRRWKEDQNLSDKDRAAGKANFSEQYLRDRTYFLDALIEASVKNFDRATSFDSDTWIAKDEVSDREITLLPTGGSDTDPMGNNTGGTNNSTQINRLRFGSDAKNEVLSGIGGDDHLYGGSGNDTLDGGKGNDYLEGNDDNDQLTGGEGADILLGGKGDDVYLFDGSFGRDVIYDSDEGDSITIDGNVLTGGKKVSKGVWEGKINGVTYTYTELDDGVGGKELYIKKEGTDGSNSIYIKKWENKHLGINLEEPEPVQNDPRFEIVAMGDTDTIKNDLMQVWSKSAHVMGGDGDDAIWTNEGMHERPNMGYLGTNDWLEGNDGNDVLISGWGDDTLDGGNGNDILYGGYTHYTSYYVGYEEIVPSGTDNDVINGGAGNDWLGGDTGNDLLNGDDGDDIIADGDGRDTINGGNGDDWILATGGTIGQVTFGVKYAGDRKFDEMEFSLPVGNKFLRLDNNPVWQVNTKQYKGKDYFGKPMYTTSSFDSTIKIYTTGEDNYSEVAIYGVGSKYGHKIVEYYNPNVYYIDPEVIAVGSISDGGAGNDHILASHGNDTARGGEGDDHIWGRGGADILSGDDGNDDIYGDSSPAHVIGIPGGSLDVWKVKDAWQAADILDGGKGNDHLYGQGGDDTVLGGEGDDVVYGDDDSEYREAFSLHGNDLLDGGDGDDTVSGGGRDDSLSGGNGNDVLWGDGYLAENKILAAAFHGSDFLDGGEGNDSLVGGGASDTLLGGEGQDALYGDDAWTDMEKLGANYGNDYLDGGADNDVVDGGGGNDTVIGGAGNDTLTGDNGSASVDAGNQGDDLLQGGAGDDDIKGDGGNDTLDGGIGLDVLKGGKGDDTYRLNIGDSQVRSNIAESIDDKEGANIIEFGAGISASSLRVSKADDGAMIMGYSSNDYVVIKGGFSGVIATYKFADGFSISNEELLRASQIGVNIDSTKENDTVSGGVKDDTITISGGKTMVTAGQGNDKIIGSKGNNTYVFRAGDGQDDLLDTGMAADGKTVVGGNSIVLGQGIKAGDVSLTTAGGSLQLKLASGDTIRLSATDIKDLQSSHALDKLQFSDGSSLTYADLLAKGVDIRQVTTQNGSKSMQGTSVSDRIYGTTGDDTMQAGAGNDTLYGGEADLMDGGEGDDTYYVSQQGTTPVRVLINDTSGETVLKLGAGFNNSDFSLVAAANENDLMFKSGSNTITVQNGKANIGKISSISFNNGSVLDKDAIARLTNVVAIDGTAGDDNITAGAAGGRIHGYAGADVINGGEGDDLFWGDQGGDTLTGGLGDDRLFGGEGNDTVLGGAGNNVLDGGEGDDVLTDGAGKSVLLGSYGDDTLQSGAGDDFLSDVYGSDTYVFNLGDGKDTIVENTYTQHDESSADRIRFGADIRRENLKASLSENGADLIIAYSDTDRITILGGADGAIETYEFADGSTLTHQDLMGTRTQSLDIYGDSDGNYLAGARANDLIHAHEGNDTLAGGAGDDSLLGGMGDDTYVFRLGDGVDTVIDAEGNNVVRFAEGIRNTDLHVRQLTRNDGNYLQIQVGSQGDQILLKDGLSLANTSYQFADGSLLKHAQLLEMSAEALVMDGTNVNDRLTGGKGNDVFDGGAGNDQLSGGHGMDTYMLGRGSGQDVIKEIEGESNLIALKDGLKLSDLVLQRSGDNLYVTISGSDDALSVSNYFSLGANWNIRASNGELASVASLLGKATPALPGTSAAKIDARRDNYMIAHRKYLTLAANSGVSNRMYFEGNVRTTVNEKISVLPTVIKKTVSDEAEITALEPDENSSSVATSDVTTSTTMLIKEGTATDGQTVVVRNIKLDELIKPGTSGGVSQPPNTTPVYAYKVDPVTGETKKVLESFIQFANLGSVYSTEGKERSVTLIERHVERTTVKATTFEDLRAGASNNHIVFSGQGYHMIDGGDGDDFIDSGMDKFANYDEDVSWTKFNPAKSNFDAQPSDIDTVFFVNDDGVSGDFLYGGNGNDTILGTTGRDEIVGGAGSDFMNGGAQGDWYRVFANDDGWDVIYDSGIVSDTTIAFPAEGLFYVDVDQSTIPKDTVIFDAGINLSDLKFSWGRFEGDTPHQTLNISWGQGKGVRIVVANQDDKMSFGVENFEFADGSRLSLANMMALAPTRPALGSNTAPVVNGAISEQKIVEKKPFSFTLPAELFSDADVGDSLTYVISRADGGVIPAWLKFDTATRTFTGTPGLADGGEMRLTVTAKDSGDLTASTNFTLKVVADAPVNTAPELKASLADQALTEKKNFSMVIPASLFVDADEDDVLSYSATLADGKALPAWLTFNAITKTLSGTPDHAAVGDLSLSILVKDKGGLTAKTSLNLHVAEYVAPNTAPVAARVLADQSLTEKAAFSFALPAGAFTDADAGDVLSYSATLVDGKPLPAWLKFDAMSKTLSGTPDHAAVGDLSLSISVKDKAGLTAKTGLNLHVAEYVAPNNAPVAAKVLADQSLTEKAAFSFALPAGAFTDADAGDVLSYSATLADGKSLPAWLTFDAQTKTLNGTPDHAAVGDLSISIQAKDKGGLTATSKLVLHIAGATPGGLSGTDAADVLTGTTTADVMSGGAGADTLSGGAGNDSLTGGTGDDVLNGDAGDDQYYYAQGDGLDFISDTAGVDSLSFASGLSLDNLIGSVATVGNKKIAQIRAITAAGDASQGIDFEVTVDAQGKVISPIEKFMLSDGKQVNWDDLLVKQVTVNGGNAAEIVRGGRNDDTIFGVDGNDTIYGGYGNDKLDGGNGEDVAYGGVGNDRIYGQSGNDALYGDDGDDLLDGSSGNDTLDGGEGRDTLDGGDGIDILYGRAGDDKLTGGNGNDMLDGGDGNDILDGGDYDDTLYGGNGDDTISAGYGNDYVSGGNGIDTITLANGNDVAQGGAGNDVITGDYGNKLVDAGDGDDTITMNVGNHWYVGGKGNDTIDPGQGLNVFAFNRGDGADIYKNNKVNGNTISLGKGIKYADLSLSKSGMDLVLKLGQGDSITLKDWYANQGLRGVDRLQFITEGGDYDAASADKTKNSKVEVFDFTKLVQKFDASLAATPGLNQWAVMTSMLDAHLYGSNTAAIGGDLSYQYGLNGNLTGIGLSVIQTSLAANDFNNNKGQALHTRPQLETGALLLI